MLILMIRMTSNISYGQGHVRVRALGRHSPLEMFDINNVGIIGCACIFNGRRDTLLSEQPGRFSTKKGGAV